MSASAAFATPPGSPIGSQQPPKSKSTLEIEFETTPTMLGHTSKAEPLPFVISPDNNGKRVSAGDPKAFHVFTILMAGLMVLSWLVSFTTLGSDYSAALTEMELEAQRLTAYMDHLKEDIRELDSQISSERNKWRHNKRTQKALQHELRVVDEMEESTGGKPLAIPTRKDAKGVIDRWLGYRRTTLENRIQQLQTYLQAMSRQALRKAYGNGPFRIKFTADVKQPSGKRTLKSFVVETVDLDSMPVSINLFMDSVAGGLWNNTAFLHNEETDHVLLAAPIDFTTHQVKNQKLGSLGWVNLGFPEYTEQHPHSTYTVGFAGMGPTFYINTVDNRVEHGPGGQGHHLLPDDADPCFGRVVEGKEVIDELVRIGMQQKEMEAGGEHVPWSEKEHRKTRIVSVQVLAN